MFAWLYLVVLITVMLVLGAFMVGALVGVAAAGFEWAIRTLGVVV